MVIDASVAIKWFIKDEEKSDKALVVLDELKYSPQLFFVPELFFNEMLAVLCRLLNSHAHIKRYMYILENLGMHRVGNGSELIQKAAEIAITNKLTGYDALYAATAALLEGSWLTENSKAHKRITVKISTSL